MIGYPDREVQQRGILNRVVSSHRSAKLQGLDGASDASQARVILKAMLEACRKFDHRTIEGHDVLGVMVCQHRLFGVDECSWEIVADLQFDVSRRDVAGLTPLMEVWSEEFFKKSASFPSSIFGQLAWVLTRHLVDCGASLGERDPSGRTVMQGIEDFLAIDGFSSQHKDEVFARHSAMEQSQSLEDETPLASPAPRSRL